MVEDSRLLVNNAFTNNAVSHGGAKEALEQVVVESTTFSPVPATLKTKAVITGGSTTTEPSHKSNRPGRFWCLERTSVNEIHEWEVEASVGT